jgi:hypothetical protein
VIGESSEGEHSGLDEAIIVAAVLDAWAVERLNGRRVRDREEQQEESRREEMNRLAGQGSAAHWDHPVLHDERWETSPACRRGGVRVKEPSICHTVPDLSAACSPEPRRRAVRPSNRPELLSAKASLGSPFGVGSPPSAARTRLANARQRLAWGLSRGAAASWRPGGLSRPRDAVVSSGVGGQGLARPTSRPRGPSGAGSGRSCRHLPHPGAA